MNKTNSSYLDSNQMRNNRDKTSFLTNQSLSRATDYYSKRVYPHVSQQTSNHNLYPRQEVQGPEEESYCNPTPSDSTHHGNKVLLNYINNANKIFLEQRKIEQSEAKVKQNQFQRLTNRPKCYSKGIRNNQQYFDQSVQKQKSSKEPRDAKAHTHNQYKTQQGNPTFQNVYWQSRRSLIDNLNKVFHSKPSPAKLMPNYQSTKQTQFKSSSQNSNNCFAGPYYSTTDGSQRSASLFNKTSRAFKHKQGDSHSNDRRVIALNAENSSPDNRSQNKRQDSSLERLELSNTADGFINGCCLQVNSIQPLKRPRLQQTQKATLNKSLSMTKKHQNHFKDVKPLFKLLSSDHKTDSKTSKIPLVRRNVSQYSSSLSSILPSIEHYNPSMPNYVDSNAFTLHDGSQNYQSCYRMKSMADQICPEQSVFSKKLNF